MPGDLEGETSKLEGKTELLDTSVTRTNSFVVATVKCRL